MRAVLLINTLFKTIEYKLNSSSNLEITELSLSGVKSQSVLLNSLNVRQEQTTTPLLPWLILMMACASALAVWYFGKETALLQSNILNIYFLLSCVFGTLWFVSRPEECHVYTDSFTNNELFKIKKPVAINNTPDSFINKLDAAIESAKQKESNIINLNTNARSQYEMHNKNVDDLLNSGMIDEVLHKRICNSMYDNVFGNKFIDEHHQDNVVYLHH